MTDGRDGLEREAVAGTGGPAGTDAGPGGSGAAARRGDAAGGGGSGGATGGGGGGGADAPGGGGSSTGGASSSGGGTSSTGGGASSTGGGASSTGAGAPAADQARPVAASANAAAPGVDLPAVIDGLFASPEWADEDRSSVSVLQLSQLRVVVTALHEGASLHNSDPDEPMTLQSLRGEAVLSVNDEGATLAEGSLVAVPSGIPWQLVATTDAVVLVTVSRH